MRFFSKSKETKDELALVLDIGSSSVGGAFFYMQANGTPKIVYSVREGIQLEDKIDFERFLFLTVRSLEKILENVSKKGIGVPKRIFCVLSSPWYASQTRTILFSKDTEFVFNTKLADSLIQREISLFEEEHLAKSIHSGQNIRPIELKNMKTMLDGYVIRKPLSKKAKQVEMTIFISMSPEIVLSKIEGAIDKYFHSKVVRFSSFAMSAFTVARDMFVQQENFLLVDIGGEVTDISMVKKDTLCQSISFPMGRNFMIRGIADSLKYSLDEAKSFLSIFKDDHMVDMTEEKFKPIVDDLRNQWLKNFQTALVNLSNDISIPATIFVTIDKDLAEFFSQTIKAEQFNQYTLTESKFRVIFLGTEALHGIALFEDNVVRDPFLIIESIYINRFLRYNTIMPKNTFQDIIKSKSENKENTINKLGELKPREKLEPFNVEIEEGHDHNKSKFALWFIAIISVVGLLFALSFLFSSAKVTVIPKTQNSDLNENFSAIKDATDSGALSFALVSVSGDESKSVQGGEEKDVADSAKGTITMFNTYSTAVQNLAINTRLEGSNGKIYKTQTKVVIPAMSKDNKPGSVDVGIYASEAGADYNSAPIDFKVLGFKNTAKYTKFYGKSKDAITGGLKGKMRLISEEDKTKTIDELKNNLQIKLAKKVSDQIPAGYVLLKDAVYLKTDEPVIGASTADGMIPITLPATFYGFLFNEQKLTKAVATKVIQNYDNSDLYISNIKDLNFNLINKENISFQDVNNIDFNLSGKTNFVWKVDTEKLVEDLLGKKKKDFNGILTGYANIASAEMAIKPIWKMSFPDKTKDIKIIVNYPQ